MATFDNSKLLEQLIADAEAAIALTFGEVVVSMQAEHTLTALATLIEAGQYQSALTMVEAAGAKLASAVNNVFVGAGTETLAAMGDKLGVVVSYDQVNARAVNAMLQNRLELIREFTETQVEATRRALLDGVEAGLNPRQQARAFRDSMGLTSRQVGFVNNYRAELEALDKGALGRKLTDGRFDKTVRRAIATDTPLSKAQIDKMVGRYRERWIAHRAETIARTEALRSVHQGTSEAMKQAIESGAVEAQNAMQTWNSAGDARVRDFANGAETSHLTMHGQQQRVGVPFVSGAGAQILHPGDPNAPPRETINCRCRATLRVSL